MPDNEPADSSLLREFLHQRSEAAFRQLTERHVDLVFGTAQRRTNDRGASEEITQNVFLALAKKAAWLQSESTLAGWLHRTAVLEAAQWWRGELRRRQREETAAQLETTMKTSDPAGGPELAGALDEALLALRDGERQAVLLRYFEGKNHREIGAALGIGEDAARKRVDKALDQIAVFFRKRGHALGGASGAAALLTGAAQAAPAWLAAQVAGGVLVRALPTGAGWLARLLGLSGLQTALLSVLLIGVPATWQTARLQSVRAEQRRLEGLLADLAGPRQQAADEWAELRGQLVLVSNEVAGAEASLNGTRAADGTEPDETDPRFYLWDESADYVRVPKSVFGRVRFDGSKDRWNLRIGSATTFDMERRRVSPAVLTALSLDAGHQAAVQELFGRNLDAYRDWAEKHSHLTDSRTLTAAVTNLPASMILNEASRVWMTPEIPDEGTAAWQREFTEELAAVMGTDRAEILLRMAHDDKSLTEALRRFGAYSGFVSVSPLVEGGVMVGKARVAGRMSVRANFNIPVSFSEILNPTEVPAFDEAAVRRQIEEGIVKLRSTDPEEEIPPMADLMEKARQSWALKEMSKNRPVLENPLPKALVEYLRQWKAAHPETPDAPVKAPHKQP